MNTQKIFHNLIAVPLLLASGLSLQAQLLNETFDSTAGFTIEDADSAETFFSDGSNDYFGIFDGDSDGGEDFGSGSTPSGVVSYSGFDDNYLVNEDIDGEGGTLPYTLTWSGISLSGETTLEISADFASSRADGPDYIIISYRVDAGAWVDVLGVAGPSGQFNTTVYEITDFGSGFGDTGATALSSAATNLSNTFSLAGTETTLDIKAEFFNDNGDDNFAMDNLVVQELSGLQPPTALDATVAAAPNNQSTIDVSFAPTAGNDVLLVYSNTDSFGTPVNQTTYAADDALPGGGTVAGVFSASPVQVSGLAPGTTYYFVAFSIDGSTNYSGPTGSQSATTATFPLEEVDFDNWTAVDVASTDRSWSINGNAADMGNFGGDAPAEDWLISPELDLDSFVGESFVFEYSSQFTDEVVGLELLYTTAYTGDPTNTDWTLFTTINTELDTNKSTSGSSTASTETTVDLSGISGSAVRVAFKYTSSGTGSGTTRNWDLQNPFISGNDAAAENITLSATPTDVDEGASRQVTLTVPTNVSGDTDFNLSSDDGDASELSFPATVTILDGTNSISFNVDGLADSTLDGDVVVTLNANAAGYNQGSVQITVNNVDAPTASSDILFTQYYEGASNNKWLEITNIGASPVDLSGYFVTVWGNANAEDWKVDGANSNTPGNSLDLTGVTLAAGQTYVIANNQAILPFDNSQADTTATVTFFNGNDSVVLYSDTTGYLTSNIVDAIAFTNSGFEGAEKGFIRTVAAVGYDLVTGSSIEDYDDDNGGPAVWTEITIADADNANFGEDAFIGTTGLVTSPTSVFFADATLSVDEGGVSIDLTVEITNPDGANSVSVDVVYNSGSSDTDLADINNYVTQTVTFLSTANSGDQQTVTISINDDEIEESTEDAIFDLSNLVTSNATALIGSPSAATVSITDNDTVIPNLFISEIVDPGDGANDGRYIEIYNPSASTVDLDAGGWTLVYYSNANTSGTDIALTGTISAGGTYIIAESANFSTEYPAATADLQNGTVNTNGDDNAELRFGGGQGVGVVVDVYGLPGTDGTGEAWEFENSRAYRNSDVTVGNPTWTASEWTIEPTNVADGNMTPGVHPEGIVGPGVASSENFNTGPYDWFNATVTGDDPWDLDTNTYAFIDGGFNETAVDNHYLVSPALDFSTLTDIAIIFEYAGAYDVVGLDSLELVYSTDYAGSGDPSIANWTVISFNFTNIKDDGTDAATGELVSSGAVNLPQLLEGLTGVHLAFRYNNVDGTLDNSEQWIIDNISVEGTDSGPVTGPDLNLSTSGTTISGNDIVFSITFDTEVGNTYRVLADDDADLSTGFNGVALTADGDGSTIINGTGSAVTKNYTYSGGLLTQPAQTFVIETTTP